MERDSIIKEYDYQKNGESFKVKTERFGVCGFNVYITAPDYKAENVKGYIPMSEDVIMADASFRVDGRRFGIKPPSYIMKEVLRDKNASTKESLEYAERRRKEKEWDNLYNEGGEGYNPYRCQVTTPKFEPYYKGDEFPD